MAHAFLKVLGSVHVEQKCTKIPYATMKEARRVMDGHSKQRFGLVAIGYGKFNAYRCPICRSYHVGHR